MKVVRGKTPCRICVQAVRWNEAFAEDDHTEEQRERPWIASGRDGLCTQCRAHVRAHRQHLLWEAKQYNRGGDQFPAWFSKQWYTHIPPKHQRATTKWRAKTRNSKWR